MLHILGQPAGQRRHLRLVVLLALTLVPATPLVERPQVEAILLAGGIPPPQALYSLHTCPLEGPRADVSDLLLVVRRPGMQTYVIQVLKLIKRWRTGAYLQIGHVS